jgi:hypothetical protein
VFNKILKSETMKKSGFLVFAVLLIFTRSAYSQVNYKVIKVDGEIVLVKTGKNLATGLVFGENEKLNFITPQSKAAVISPTKGRMILAYDNASKSGANYLPAMSNISTRQGSILNLLDLKNNFTGKYVILDRIEIELSAPEFPMNEDNFFYITYLYNNEAINKKLKYNGQKLIIDKTELFTVDGSPIPNPNVTDVKLYYFKDNHSSLFINEFNPVFPNLETLKQEVQLIADGLKGKTKSEILDEVISYLSDFYGKADKENVRLWMEKNIVY